MPRDEYQAALDALRERVLTMGDIVVSRLETALSALERDDDELAREVVDGDEEVNDRYLDIESDCIDLLALQQPVAGDLRTVVASFKITTDLERIGDLATNLGSYVLAMRRDSFADVNLLNIGSFALDMVEDALEAYARRDSEACRAIADRDDELDGLCERVGELVVRQLVGTNDDDATAESLFTEVNKLLLTVRDLERVGDHAVNIAARTLYMVENSDELLY